MRWIVVMLCLASGAALAQDAQDPKESLLHAELRREGERVSDACTFSFKAIPMCGYTLFTDHPLHIAAGSMPAQNGFGLGGAFVWTKNTRNWRLSWDADAIGAISGGAWRAGGYMKLIHTPHPTKPVIEVVIPTPGEKPKASEKKKVSAPFTHPYTVFNLYAQSISLNKLKLLRRGERHDARRSVSVWDDSDDCGRNVIKPVYEWPAIRKLGLSLQGEVDGRS